jgi:hypothetical protein
MALETGFLWALLSSQTRHWEGAMETGTSFQPGGRGACGREPGSVGTGGAGGVLGAAERRGERPLKRPVTRLVRRRAVRKKAFLGKPGDLHCIR